MPSSKKSKVSLIHKNKYSCMYGEGFVHACAGLVRRFATTNILRLSVDLTTGGDVWNVIKIMFRSKNTGNENSENAK